MDPLVCFLRGTKFTVPTGNPNPGNCCTDAVGHMLCGEPGARFNPYHCMTNSKTSQWACARGTSTYATAGYYGDYNAYLSVDGSLSPGNSGFYHTSLEPYPYLKIQLGDITKPTDLTAFKEQDVKRIEVYSRVDANELYHKTAFTVDNMKGTRIINTCKFTPADFNEVWIQKTTQHSHGGGWPNYNGNRWNSYSGNAPAQNSNLPTNFIIINEVVLY